ncbi:MAG TPA: hypothetical protein VJ323_04930, partial [Bryobacteraceae bacterium]|nr:hypothetical protein [Bryobacteraceae bacterium]
MVSSFVGVWAFWAASLRRLSQNARKLHPWPSPVTYPVFEALSFRMARHPGGIRKQSGQNADRSRLSDGPRFARNGFIERGLTSRNDAEEYRDLKH